MRTMKSDKKKSLQDRQNIFNSLVSLWDKNKLQAAMNHAVESIPVFIVISIRFTDEVKNYRCNVFRSGNRFVISGCRESNNIVMFPQQEYSV